MGRQTNTPDIVDIARLQERIGRYGSQSFQMLALIGEETFELIVNLLVLVMVEHASGQEGLGIYAYLMACLYSARYVSQWGVARFIEKETAALHAQPKAQQQVIQHGYQAILTTALVGSLAVLATAGFDTAHTTVQERIGAYIITAAILPVANVNALKLAILQGMGQHAQVAKLRMLRSGLILGGIFLATGIHVPPSYLLAIVLLAEIAVAIKSKGRPQLPAWSTLFKHKDRILPTLKKGQAYLFTDNALDVMLNLDLLVLGWFVTSWDLGVYAEAAVLVRFFLVIPVGLKPLLRRQYTIMASQNQMDRLTESVRRHTAILFSIFALLAVVVMLHFPVLLDLLFEIRGETRQSFSIFIIFIPGLLYYGTLLAPESAYEALGRADALKRLSISMVGINFILTIYLVPAAGFYGAATATMLTMLVHFALFGRRLAITGAVNKSALAAAGMGTYLVYQLLKALDWGTTVTGVLALLLIGFVIYACGIFGTRTVANRP